MLIFFSKFAAEKRDKKLDKVDISYNVFKETSSVDNTVGIRLAIKIYSRISYMVRRWISVVRW
ncbi:hypothetical protein HMPREF1991_03117 [Hoylesella loescheii DSM 19665 = JCM 12249 = ATCC 15930]|uniref:Uncharacterized protein n=1 Tax=Hoylesella loescheii DSM 19665 = JCM 12249 = ATCC 15930 TaxID=1122985 RepID=A0A069QDD7_HOYLO|nr:hypothetical protein HMPREF1991_03117 [Hoylesella loescheii DSM 19665 = JCM 12249 = ATCC 15930]